LLFEKATSVRTPWRPPRRKTASEAIGAPGRGADQLNSSTGFAVRHQFLLDRCKNATMVDLFKNIRLKRHGLAEDNGEKKR
jgi:hypothetical protein